MGFLKKFAQLKGRILLLEEQHRQDQKDLIRVLSKIDSRIWILEAVRNAKDKD